MVDPISLHRNVRLTSAHSFFVQKVPQTVYCLSGSLICLFLSSVAYWYSWITFSFANTSFKIAATSSFSYQKEAEGFQMAQRELGGLQSRLFGGNTGCSFPIFLICLFCLFGGFNQEGCSDLVYSLAYKHLWQHNRTDRDKQPNETALADFTTGEPILELYARALCNRE